MNRFFTSLLVCFTVCFSFKPLFAEEPSQPSAQLKIPVIDLPYNGQSYFPNYFSMRQSLALSTSFYEGMHSWIGGPPDEVRRSGRIWGILAFDLVSMYFPLGNSWLHEEWHRSVMTNRGIGSFNDVNLLPIGQEIIAVSHVDDADLIRLKRDHPADQVRLSAAGMESQVVQNLEIEKHQFFQETQTYDQILLWMNAIGVTSYLLTCSSGQEADSKTDHQNRSDGIDISRRDFTGLDCTAWVYDLFRPDEPYANRGAHPSNVGVDRYIRHSDLSARESQFLHLQANLSFLNFADPFLFSKKDFHGHLWGKDFQWNAKLSHFLTSFGASIDSTLFLKTQSSQKFLVTWHHGMTDSRYWPGLTVEWIEVTRPTSSWKSSHSLTLWRQPRGQRLEETNAETVVHALTEWSYWHTRNFGSFYGLEAKTPGWIAGNAYLDRNVSFFSGITWALDRF